MFKTQAPDHLHLWKQFCKTNFSTTRLLLIFRQLTSAVVFLHAHGIVHRDLHPQRLHWSNGRPVFNIIGLPYNYIKLLKGRNFLGHLSFSPPEALHSQGSDDDELTSAVDIWSLGCCLYYFVVKRDPFESSKGQQEQTKINIMNMNIGELRPKDPLIN